MNITSPSVRHTRFTVGIPKDLKIRSVQSLGSGLTGCLRDANLRSWWLNIQDALIVGRLCQLANSLCKFSGLQSRAVEVFIHLGYCALSLGVCYQKLWDCMVISSSRVKGSVKEWISSDIWPFKMRPLSGLEMLNSKHLVAECHVAEWWSPLVLTYVLEALAASIFRVVQEDPPSLRWSKKKEYIWASLKIEAASSSKFGKCLPLNMVWCEKTWILISTV
jgi:hypothetical protein